MNYNSIGEFISEHEKIQYHLCKKCNALVELVFENYSAKINGYEIEAKSLPQLRCTKCGFTNLTMKSSIIVAQIYKELERRGDAKVCITPRSLNKRYEFCKEIDFDYDYRDYENIPGLSINEDGFLTPVYFKKAVLVYFMHHPEYGLNLFSETYGSIEGEGFDISFGINSNDKVIFWLGDLDTLDQNTLLALKANNITSDHTLIDSEFYEAQLNAQFSEPIIERRIVNLRIRFFDLFQLKFGVSLHHLENEVLDALIEIRKPVTYSLLEVKPVISALHKILIEAVNISNLKQHYESTVSEKDKNYKQWKSIKFFESHLSNHVANNDTLREALAPLYILNDLRIVYFHLVSGTKIDELKHNAIASLGVTDFDDTRNLYENLMKKLEETYNLFVDSVSS